MSILQQMEKKDESKLRKGVCCSRCYKAKTEKAKCKCRCKGEHHGKGVIKRLADMEEKKDEDDKSASSRTTS